MTKLQDQERQEARDDLLTGYIALQPGETVYTILRRVSSNGMTRWLDLYMTREGEPWRITWATCRASGRVYDQKWEAMKVGGCGMDMGFDAVYALGRALWPDGYACTEQGSAREEGVQCQSNDHSNDPRGVYEWHKDGGYALRHRWL